MSQGNTRHARKAFVTGASQGLGAEIAAALARDGYDVAVSGRRTATLLDTVRAIEAAGARATTVALDLRDQSSVEQAMASVVGAFGHVDVLVNNAAVTLRRTVLDMARDEWQEVINVNLTGTLFMSQQMGRHLVATQRAGCVVSLASTHGIVGFPERSAYGVSKAGIVHMTRALAIEWAVHGIRVNAVAPGTASSPTRVAYFAANPVAGQAMIDRVPLKRFAQPDEVSAAVVYLASPAASYITGQTLLLDGGLTAY